MFEAIENKLAAAREYEAEGSRKISDEERPLFHLTPTVGWMNDPNGFSYYNGEYHMFYQYYPYDTNWGPMHWGHAVSNDLLNWEIRPAAIAPDEDYDHAGCFSGSAIGLSDGKMMLMYTGVRRELKEDGTYGDVQTQCLAFGDGTDFEKYPMNPVLTEEDLPAGGSRVDFRDPKVWLGSDGIYRCAVANRPADKSGQILLYTSEDAIHWKYKKVLASNGNRIGKMWECPDFFVLDGKGVLLTSPQDMENVGLKYRSGNGSICLIGTYDEATDTFTEEADLPVDYGIDFYAHQSVLTPDGRRVMIGWMQNWDCCGYRIEEPKWFGQMSIPREISIKNGKLIQKPIRELEQFRTEEVSYEGVLTDDELKVEGVNGRCIDMELEISAADKEKIYHSFEMRFAQDEKHYSAVKFTPAQQILEINRKQSGTRRAVMNQSECHAGEADGSINLRIVLDRFSAEVFADDGEHVMTMTCYVDPDAKGISFHADGAVELKLKKYELKK